MPKNSDNLVHRGRDKKCCDVKIFANAAVASSSVALENQWEETEDNVQRVNANASAHGNNSDTDSDAGQEHHVRVVKKIAGILKTDVYRLSWHVEDGAAPYEIAVAISYAGRVLTRQSWSRNDHSIECAVAEFYEVADFKTRTRRRITCTVETRDCFGRTDSWTADLWEA
jgi:hypothetical protein